MAGEEEGTRSESEEVGVLHALVGRIDDAGRREGTGGPGDSDEIAVIRRASTPASRPSAADLASEVRDPDVDRRRRVLRSLLGRELDMGLAAVAATALGDAEAEIRTLALEVLGRAPHLTPTDALEPVLGDPIPEIRCSALELVGRSRDPRAVELIEARLRIERNHSVIATGLAALQALLSGASAAGTDGAVVDRVLAVIGTLAPSRHHPFAEQLQAIGRSLREEHVLGRLRSRDDEVRAGAAIVAVERGSRWGLEEVAALLHDDSPAVRRLAMVAAARPRRSDQAAGGERGVDLGPPSAPTRTAPAADLSDLLRRLERAEEAEEVLASLETVPMRAWLAQRVEDAGPTDLVRLGWFLSGRGGPGALGVLAEATLRLPDERTRRELLSALRQAPSLRDLLASWRGHPDATRRAEALRLDALIKPDPTALERGLRDSDATVRLAAIEAAGDQLGGFLTKLMLRLLRSDPSPRVRRAAVGAFLRAPVERRIKTAEAALGVPDGEVRLGAVGLLRSGTPGETAVLAKFLMDRDPEVAAMAAATICQQPSPDSLALLWTALRAADPERRAALMDAVTGLDRDAVLRLAGQAVQSSSQPERNMGLTVLSRLRGEEAVPSLIEALVDPGSEVRVEALRGLAGLAGKLPPAAVEAVGDRLGDPDPSVREAAVRVLASVEVDRVVPYLVTALGDPAVEVSASAREGLMARRSISVAEELTGALASPARRRAAAEVLAAMPDESIEVLASAIPAAEPSILPAIGVALSAAGAGPVLIEQLEDRHPATRLRAVRALAAMEAGDAVERLIGRLTDPEPQVRAASAMALGALGREAALEPLKRAFVRDPDMDVVASIETALRQLTSIAKGTED
jgi:HEAT repeat protein